MRDSVKNIKNKITAVFLVLLCLLTLGGCVGKDLAQEEGKNYDIYYLDSERCGLVSEPAYCPGNEGDMVGTIDELFEKLQTDGPDGQYNRPIPANLKVSDFQIKENQIAVYFSAAYNNISKLDEILCRAAIVKTLCQVDGIEYVEFYVEDQPLMVNGTAVGLMSEENFLMNLNETSEQTKQVTLYLADEGGEKLRTLSTQITYNAAEPLAYMLVQTLIDGPAMLKDVDTSHVIQTIPEDTALNSVTIRDNICYVDLSKDFTGMIPDVSSDVVIYSIVDTLCELSNVNKVQFSIDGEPVDKYGETLNFHLPFERNLDLVMGEVVAETSEPAYPSKNMR